MASDGLQSPAVDNKLDVFPLPEETTGVNSNQKSSDDHKTSSKQNCSPGYSKMALETDTASSKQENAFKNITGPPIFSVSREDERRKSEKTLNSKHNGNYQFILTPIFGLICLIIFMFPFVYITLLRKNSKEKLIRY